MVLRMPSLIGLLHNLVKAVRQLDIGVFSKALNMCRYGTRIICLQQDVSPLAYVLGISSAKLYGVSSTLHAPWYRDAWLSGSRIKYSVGNPAIEPCKKTPSPVLPICTDISTT